MKTRVVIRNLPSDIEKKHVETLVSRFGKIKSTYVARDPEKPNLAFAEVVMTKETEAENAVDVLSDESWHGKVLEAGLAEEDWE